MQKPIRILGSLLLLLVVCSAVRATEVERRFRLSFSFGGFNAQDEVRSDAANVLSIVDSSGAETDRFIDPRDDAAVSGNLEVKAGSVATLAAQYALSRFFLIEASVGFQKADVGDIEVHVLPRFDRIPAGELTMVPLQLTGIARFRPRKKLNPYVGGGFGYTLLGFEPSSALDALSARMSATTGFPAVLATVGNGNDIRPVFQAQPRQMVGAEIVANDAWTWHVTGGAEFSFSKHWAAFVDLRYIGTTAELTLKFDDGAGLGVSVPAGSAPENSDLATGTYGSLFFEPGRGVVDVDRDGSADSGVTYVSGGTIDLDGFTGQVGVRYTF